MKKGEGIKRSCMRPMSNIIVSSRDKSGRNNALVVGYACNCSFDPPMIMVGIHPTRFSYPIIKESGCFVVNMAVKENKEMYDYLGSVSGRDEDKFAKLAIETEEAEHINAPLLSKCPVNIECEVVDSIITGSHEMFIGVVKKVHVDKKFLGADGKIAYDKMDLI